MDIGYPRGSLGWAFQRALTGWGIPEARLAAHLGLAPDQLVALAACPMPPVSSAAFGDRVDALAAAFGVPRWRLDFVCRAGALEAPRLR